MKYAQLSEESHLQSEFSVIKRAPRPALAGAVFSSQGTEEHKDSSAERAELGAAALKADSCLLGWDIT